jgi:hypothetical protein
MSRGNRNNHSEDMFEETRMSFGDHIEDLRTHLIRAILWFIFFVVISFFPFIGKNVLRFIAKPVEDELARYWDKYYRERSNQLLMDLRGGGDEDLESRNQPVPARIRVKRQQLLRDTGLDAGLRRLAQALPAGERQKFFAETGLDDHDRSTAVPTGATARPGSPWTPGCKTPWKCRPI